MQERLSGVLMHPTSLPSPYGIGDLGQGAREFVNFLEKAGQRLWQVLPLGPVGYGESPYSSYSSFAGNPLIIDLDDLIERGWLNREDLSSIPNFPLCHVDFPLVRQWKVPLLEVAASRFVSQAMGAEKATFKQFCVEESYWLDDFALFMAVKEYYEREIEKKRTEKGDFSNSSWNQLWDEDIRRYEVTAVKKWNKKLASRVEVIRVIQFFFFSQWKALKVYANEKGVQIVGDIPIFVAPDSADVWSHREAFLLDKDGNSMKVAGVPPDYFSPEGQRWGNPLYDWKAMEKDGFSWWIERIKSLLTLVDIVRIDHFRGFEAYWEISATEMTAVNGKWVKGGGDKLFKKIKEVLGKLPIIAEDLGMITPEVHELREKFGFPGMKILQFAFEMNQYGQLNAGNGYLPHNCEVNSVIYTGTHDNDTTLGWFFSLPDDVRDQLCRFLGRDGHDIVWDLIRVALSSPSRIALFPMQDLLCYGSEARMNTPSTVGGLNWAWRIAPGLFSDGIAYRMGNLCQLYGRR